MRKIIRESQGKVREFYFPAKSQGKARDQPKNLIDIIICCYSCLLSRMFDTDVAIMNMHLCLYRQE